MRNNTLGLKRNTMRYLTQSPGLRPVSNRGAQSDVSFDNSVASSHGNFGAVPQSFLSAFEAL